MAEVGCGFGRIGERISGRAGVRWVGADLSRDQLVEARGRSAPIRPRLLEASATALPFRDSSADLVLAVEVLMHIPPEQIKSALAELWRVSRRYILHIDWFEDYLIGYGTAWSWVHDYTTLWQSFGARPDVSRLRASGLQRAFLVTKPATGSH
ncbi:MAG: class I SAM-dependent methyltransferase [Candidatus Thermoplasmatota archaeon]